MGLSYNNWETMFLRSAVCIVVLRSLATQDSPYQHTLDTISLVLFILPTVIVVVASFLSQCLAQRGGYGRFRQLSLALWWKRRKRQATKQTRAHSQLDERALAYLMQGARDPLLVERFREEQ